MVAKQARPLWCAESSYGPSGGPPTPVADTIRAWCAEADADGLDAVVVNTSGCGTTVKDYGHLFRDDPRLAADAARISALARDISEILESLPLKFGPALKHRVAYHSACSLQHGQRITAPPLKLPMFRFRCS